LKGKRILIVMPPGGESAEMLETLSRHPGSVQHARNLEEARAALHGDQVDVMVIDGGLLEGRKVHAATHLRASSALAGIPVIAMVRQSDIEKATGMMADWAQDFVKKPVLADELLVRCQLATERKQQQDQLYDQATRDPLTGLYNRRYLMEFLVGQVYGALRGTGRITLILSDPDGFKAVNDTHGHMVGDAVLKTLAEIMVEGTRCSDVCARYGGDEFAIACPSGTLEECRQLAERLRESIERCSLLGLPTGLRVTASFGVAEYDADRMEHSVESLLSAADEALLEAKAGGKNQTVISGGYRGGDETGNESRRVPFLGEYNQSWAYRPPK